MMTDHLTETALHTTEILARAGGHVTAGQGTDFIITDITIDSRRCCEGSLFVALPGAHADGHNFVVDAAKNGARAALVSRIIEDPALQASGCAQILVGDTLQALGDLAVMGRIAHQQKGGRLVGITGSVGKTGSKEMLAHILRRMGGCHANKASFNNHVGVPLTLAALPAEAPVAIQEMGMNAPGEIADLSLMAGPDIALITRIADSHAGFFTSLAEIAAAKAEIFDGLCGLGVAVLNRDDEFFDDLSRRAKLAGAGRIISFGIGNDAEFCLLSNATAENSQKIEADCAGIPLTFTLGMAAPHWALNALGILAVIEALGLDVGEAANHLADFSDLPGRGAQHHGIFAHQPVTLVDDSYNAGPASMAAALSGLADTPPDIMVLSDMLELGDGTAAAHDALVPPLTSLAPRDVIVLGPQMGRMATALEAACPAVTCHPANDSEQAFSLLAGLIQPHDRIFIKGSNGSGAHRIANSLINELTPPPEDTTDGARRANPQKGEFHAA
jgi:UDP-N-acetylmuramoyl-tripeptide--D-alanyl-D-alanine ligase